MFIPVIYIERHLGFYGSKTRLQCYVNYDRFVWGLKASGFVGFLAYRQSYCPRVQNESKYEYLLWIKDNMTEWNSDQQIHIFYFFKLGENFAVK